MFLNRDILQNPDLTFRDSDKDDKNGFLQLIYISTGHREISERIASIKLYL